MTNETLIHYLEWGAKLLLEEDDKLPTRIQLKICGNALRIAAERLKPETSEEKL